MADETEETADPGRPSSKVARVIDEYGLEGYGDELERQWLGEGDERQSLRELATQLNRRVLEAAIRNAGDTARPDEVSRMYTALTDSDVSGGMRQEVQNDLERTGVDVETLQKDFVSHQAVHTYLREYRGVERESEPTDRIASTREAIERLQGRLQAVVERNLETLVSTDRIALGSFDVIVTVSVVCTDCNRQYSVFELLDRGRCDCEHDE
jgi:hypothetical protein